jgi:hypothetical protein
MSSDGVVVVIVMWEVGRRLQTLKALLMSKYLNIEGRRDHVIQFLAIATTSCQCLSTILF